MSKYCQLVMGPAGSGKSTYCHTLNEFIISDSIKRKRSPHIINLDPAADQLQYEPTIDIRELISVDDVMQELDLGPNGGLIYCLEFFLDNVSWFEDKLGDFDEDYLIVDCPGQIELTMHTTILKSISDLLIRFNYKVCGVYLVESNFVVDINKYFSGVLSSLAAMVHLEIPYISVLSKVDLLQDKEQIEKYFRLNRFLCPDPTDLLQDAQNQDTKYAHLNLAICRLVEEYSMVQFIPLDITNEDTIEELLMHIDNSIQYGESEEVREPKEYDIE